MSLRFKAPIFLSIMVVILLPIVGLFSFQQAKKQLLKETTQKLIAVADVQEKRINGVLERYLEQVRLITSITDLKVQLKNYNAQHSIGSLNQIGSIISNAKLSLTTVDEIEIYNNQSVAIASTNPQEDHDLHKLDLHGARGDVFELVEIFKDESNRLRVRIFGPLIFEGKNIGTVELVMSAAPLVAVTEDYSGLGKTGEVVLAKKNQSGDALFLAPLRFDAGAALTRAIAQNQSNNPMIDAINGKEGIFMDGSSVDYRGQPVFAVTRFIDTLDWGLVVKIDQDEALTPANSLIVVFMTITFIASLIAIGLSYVFSTIIIRPVLQLTYVASKLEKGDFSVQAPAKSRDEIGQLGQAFNTMAGKLKELYEGLEEKIRQRTEQLSQKVLDLENAKKATINLLEDLKEEKNRVEEAKVKDEAILSSIGDGLIATDAQGRVVLINQSAQNMLGFVTDELFGKLVTQVVEIFDEKGQPIPKNERPMTKALQSTQKVSQLVYYKRKDGSKFAVALSVAPIILDQKTIGGIEVFRDISKEKEVDRMKTEFISLASHQLRTPLSAMKWFSEMLLVGDAGALASKQKEYVQNIYDSNDRMIDLVNGLLNISRIESGRLIIEPQPTDLAELVKQILTQLKQKIDEKKLQLIVSIHESLPKINIDSKLIAQVYMNLLTNAIKYTPKEGEISVMISKKGEEIISQVSDTGYGIPKKDESKVFSKFFRADNVTKIETEGTGLGLYLAKAIIFSSGGRIWFESEENRGTTFWFSLPLSGSKAQKGEVTLDS